MRIDFKIVLILKGDQSLLFGIQRFSSSFDTNDDPNMFVRNRLLVRICMCAYECNELWSLSAGIYSLACPSAVTRRVVVIRF